MTNKDKGVSGTAGTFAVALSDEAYKKIQAKEYQLNRLLKMKVVPQGEVLTIKSQISILEEEGQVSVGSRISSFIH